MEIKERAQKSLLHVVLGSRSLSHDTEHPDAAAPEEETPRKWKRCVLGTMCVASWSHLCAPCCAEAGQLAGATRATTAIPTPGAGAEHLKATSWQSFSWEWKYALATVEKNSFFRCMSFRYHLIHHTVQPLSPRAQISRLSFTEYSTVFEVCSAPALSAEQWKCHLCHCTSRVESVTCLAWEWFLVWFWAQMTSSWFSSLICVAAWVEHRDVAGSRGKSSVTSFNSKSVAVRPLKRNCVLKPKKQTSVPSVLSSE